NHEAFYVSHAMEPVNIPAQETVDEFLPPLVQEHMLDPENGESFGYVCDQITMRQSRVDLSDAMEQVIGAAAEASSEWKRLTGREYDIIEPYRCDNAELVIVAMGSMCGTVYDAVDALRDSGKQIGLLKIRMFRPFPVEAVRNALTGIATILVLDRNFSPGIGGVLHQEVRSALYGVKNAPRLHGYLAGVGGINVSPGKIEEFVNVAISKTPVDNSVWVE
ncbi:MAG: transketolase C-terminal domain-containing protein, partial [Gammaproteobacteria bacterium]